MALPQLQSNAMPAAQPAGRVQVVLRVRPVLQSEDKEGSQVLWADTGSNTLHLRTAKQSAACVGDAVFDGSASQETVWQSVAPAIATVCSGRNATLLAYGVTSAGKTFSLFGPGTDNGRAILLAAAAVGSSVPEERAALPAEAAAAAKLSMGIVPRAVLSLFDRLGEADMQWRVYVSMAQVYNERVYDLLTEGASNTALRVHESPENGVFVEGLSEYAVSSARDALRLLAWGAANRTTRATAFNEASSRSHAITQIALEITPSGGTTVTRAVLTLCDLAGSERWADSGMPSKAHTSELVAINSSLLTLGRCISAVVDSQAAAGEMHVPYRDSTLTFLLRDALGGNSATTCLCTFAPRADMATESFSTMLFADKAKQVMTHARVNVCSVPDRVLVKLLQAEVARLRGKLLSLGEAGFVFAAPPEVGGTGTVHGQTGSSMAAPPATAPGSARGSPGHASPSPRDSPRRSSTANDADMAALQQRLAEAEVSMAKLARVTAEAQSTKEQLAATTSAVTALHALLSRYFNFEVEEDGLQSGAAAVFQQLNTDMSAHAQDQARASSVAQEPAARSGGAAAEAGSMQQAAVSERDQSPPRSSPSTPQPRSSPPAPAHSPSSSAQSGASPTAGAMPSWSVAGGLLELPGEEEAVQRASTATGAADQALQSRPAEPRADTAPSPSQNAGGDMSVPSPPACSTPPDQRCASAASSTSEHSCGSAASGGGSAASTAQSDSQDEHSPGAVGSSSQPEADEASPAAAASPPPAQAPAHQPSAPAISPGRPESSPGTARSDGYSDVIRAAACATAPGRPRPPTGNPDPHPQSPIRPLHASHRPQLDTESDERPVLQAPPSPLVSPVQSSETRRKAMPAARAGSAASQDSVHSGSAGSSAHADGPGEEREAMPQPASAAFMQDTAKTLAALLSPPVGPSGQSGPAGEQGMRVRHRNRAGAATDGGSAEAAGAHERQQAEAAAREKEDAARADRQAKLEEWREAKKQEERERAAALREHMQEAAKEAEKREKARQRRARLLKKRLDKYRKEQEAASAAATPTSAGSKSSSARKTQKKRSTSRRKAATASAATPADETDANKPPRTPVLRQTPAQPSLPPLGQTTSAKPERASLGTPHGTTDPVPATYPAAMPWLTSAPLHMPAISAGTAASTQAHPPVHAALGVQQGYPPGAWPPMFFPGAAAPSAASQGLHAESMAAALAGLSSGLSAAPSATSAAMPPDGMAMPQPWQVHPAMAAWAMAAAQAGAFNFPGAPAAPPAAAASAGSAQGGRASRATAASDRVGTPSGAGTAAVRALSRASGAPSTSARSVPRQPDTEHRSTTGATRQPGPPADATSQRQRMRNISAIYGPTASRGRAGSKPRNRSRSPRTRHGNDSEATDLAHMLNA